MRARPLKDALQEVARRFHVELLVSDEALKGRKAARLSGTFTAREALAALLAGSGLAVEGSAGGGFIVTVAEPGGQAQMPVPAVPDILVVGTITQNADIRRMTNDVQPIRCSPEAMCAISMPPPSMS
jgi:iron complex outermembrane receptor protein/outer membrane receptor for ferric coprogen and ferric-rhodotorulic acid